MRKREFATPPQVLSLLALAPIIANATVGWIPPRAVGFALAGVLLIMFSGWGLYAIRAFRFSQRQRRIAAQARGQREADLRRFAESLAARD